MADKRLRSAVERKLGIMGEAPRRISGGFMAMHPGLPWRSIIGMRNLLAHEYGEVNVQRVYFAASKKVLKLLGQLERILNSQSL